MDERGRLPRPRFSRGRNLAILHAHEIERTAEDITEYSMTGQGISTSPDEGTAGLRLARPRYSCMCSEQVLAGFLEETIEEGKSLQEENTELTVDARPKQLNMSLCKRLRSYLKRNNWVGVLPFEESHIVGPPPAIIDPTPAAPPRLIFVRPCAIISPTQESLNPESENIGIADETLQDILGEPPWNVEEKPSKKSLWKQLQSRCKWKKSSTVKAEVQQEDMTPKCCFSCFHF
ncbi:hypothetical protein DPEC_G00045580 [Dallia pectoralis]|uniref:Uncharacterized protein n=1 Tax=Dallia pectoralis TaxID=75939 RepID=A0ACC2H9Z7_DALPE|nr:hypothetical protein DPEC_G00045580 [Dallia pectoralis]